MTHAYKNPKDYSDNNKLQHEFAKKFLSKIKIFPADRILDIGCGDGSLTASELATATQGSVIGTDVSQQMIDHANEKYTSKQKNLRFITMDASKNVFLNQFDVIISFNALHWVKDQKAALQGIANAAADNARIALLLSHKKSTYHHALDAVCKHSKWSSYFVNYESPRSFFEIDVYRKLLEETGFKIISLTEEEMSYNLHSEGQLKDFSRASMANIKQIPAHLKEEFLDDFAKEFIRMLGLEQTNSIPVSFWCLQVIAVKSDVHNKNNSFIPINS